MLEFTREEAGAILETFSNGEMLAEWSPGFGRAFNRPGDEIVFVGVINKIREDDELCRIFCDIELDQDTYAENIVKFYNLFNELLSNLGLGNYLIPGVDASTKNLLVDQLASFMSGEIDQMFDTAEFLKIDPINSELFLMILREDGDEAIMEFARKNKERIDPDLTWCGKTAAVLAFDCGREGLAQLLAELQKPSPTVDGMIEKSGQEPDVKARREK